MPDRRTADTDVTSTSEDWGIFKNATVSVRLEVTPLRRETSRGDLLCAGYSDDARIEVVFPGRRRSAASQMETALDQLMRKENAAAQSRGAPAPHVVDLRMPLKAEGTWRTRLMETDDEDLERIYQFLAARWSFHDQNGQEKTFGEPVLQSPAAKAQSN